MLRQKAKARARVYEDYNQMEVNVDSEEDEVEFNMYEEKVQQRWRYTDQRHENLRPNVEDNKSNMDIFLIKISQIWWQ